MYNISIYICKEKQQKGYHTFYMFLQPHLNLSKSLITRLHVYNGTYLFICFNTFYYNKGVKNMFLKFDVTYK